MWNPFSQEWDFADQQMSDQAKQVINGVSQETAPFANFVNCGAAVAYPFLTSFYPGAGLLDAAGNGEILDPLKDAGELGVDSRKEALEEQVDKLRRWHKRIIPTQRAVGALKVVGATMTAFNVYHATEQGLTNLNNGLNNGCSGTGSTE